MAEHFDDFNKIITNLLNLDVKIDDEDEALLLLDSLPKSYEFLVTTLLHGAYDIYFEDVSNALINNDVRKKNKEAYQDSSSNVLTARGRTFTWKKRKCGKSRSKSRGKYDTWRKLDKNECAILSTKMLLEERLPDLKREGVKVQCG